MLFVEITRPAFSSPACVHRRFTAQVAFNDDAGDGSLASMVKWRCDRDDAVSIRTRSYDFRQSGNFKITITKEAEAMA